MESLASHTPAHNSTATVAPFQAWRNLQIVIAKEPTKLSITALLSTKDVRLREGVDYGEFVAKFQELIAKWSRVFQAIVY